MPKRISRKFRDEAETRRNNGLPSVEEADAAVDEMIKKNIRDRGA
jgi:hypothetical protein